MTAACRLVLVLGVFCVLGVSCYEPLNWFNAISSILSFTKDSSVPESVWSRIADASAGVYEFLSCRFTERECCNGRWIREDIGDLVTVLKTKIHGQHLAVDVTAKMLSAHFRNAPAKPLVLSLHGWTGGGKNFMSRVIAEGLYAKGMESKFVKLFVGSRDFPHETADMTALRTRITTEIETRISQCQRTLFIFDEIDKMPPKLLDSIKPYLDHYPRLGGVDYRKAIFLFLSNTGGDGIQKRTLEHSRAGLKREDIALKDMEEIIENEVYHGEQKTGLWLWSSGGEKSGLWNAELIEKGLITAFVPFLPLELRHVKECIRDELARHYPEVRGRDEREEIVDNVAAEMNYFKDKLTLFSTSGCKRVAQKVSFILEDYYLD